MKAYTKIMLLFTACYSANIGMLKAEGMASQNALFRMGAEQITLSDNETLGWVGTSYLLEVFPDFFIGASLYGAADGDRGGFFSIGPEFTLRSSLLNDWYADIGLYVGGGGGGGANDLVGGGLVVRPHLDLIYKFGSYQAGLSASHVRFPSGTISSSQVGLVFSSLSDFYHIGSDEGDTPRQAGLHGGIGFDRIRGTTAIYHGELLDWANTKGKVTMLGMRADHMITPTTYWGIEVVGAAQGELGGYGEYLGTFGIEHPILGDMLSVGARVGLGMAGGGGAATQGGLLAKAGVNLTANLSSNYHISLEGGYVVAPAGQMRAGYIGADLTVDLDHPYSGSGAFETNSYEWQIGAFNYHTVVPTGSSTSIPLGGVEIRVNHFFDDHFYYGLHIMYAAKGGNYGGYGHTFADVGYRSPELLNGLTMAAEFAVGGGGGASISVGGGALYMGNVYLDYKLGSEIGIRIGAGRLQALKGDLDTMVTEALITYSYALEERH